MNDLKLLLSIAGLVCGVNGMLWGCVSLATHPVRRNIFVKAMRIYFAVSLLCLGLSWLIGRAQ